MPSAAQAAQQGWLHDGLTPCCARCRRQSQDPSRCSWRRRSPRKPRAGGSRTAPPSPGMPISRRAPPAVRLCAGRLNGWEVKACCCSLPAAVSGKLLLCVRSCSSCPGLLPRPLSRHPAQLPTLACESKQGTQPPADSKTPCTRVCRRGPWPGLRCGGLAAQPRGPGQHPPRPPGCAPGRAAPAGAAAGAGPR